MAASPHEFHPRQHTTPQARHLHPVAGCHRCEGTRIDHRFSMAFQPIVDTRSGRVMAYEALARGVNDEPAATVLDPQHHGNRIGLDQRCRVKAIELASMLGLNATGADLSINFFPNASYEAEDCLKQTVKAANRVGLPLTRLIFEINEMEPLHSTVHLKSISQEYRRLGIRTAIDDFGSGFAGLSMLAAFQPDIVKLDIALTRNIYERRASQIIAPAVVQICADLGIQVIAEGVEKREEREALQELGIFHLQGFHIARPGFEHLPLWKG